MRPKIGQRFKTTNDNELSYDPETRTIAAGETQQLVTWCDWVEFLSVTVDSLQVSLNGSYFFPLALGLILRPRGGIRRLFVKNPTGAAITVTISKGLGEVDDRRVVISPTTTLNVNPLPTAYGASQRYSGAAGSGLASNTVVAAGANLNGVQVIHYTLACRADPTAYCEIRDSTGALARVHDSQVAACSMPFTIPAGQNFRVELQGDTFACVQYRIL